MKNTISALALCLLVVGAAACGGSSGGETNNTTTDAGSTIPDAGNSTDAGTETDAGTVTPDAGTEADAGTVTPDAGTETDAGTVTPDAGTPETGPCASATLLTAGAIDVYSVDDTTPSVFQSGTGCSFRNGHDRVFAIDVPAGKRLYAAVRGVADYDPAISLVAEGTTCSPSGMTCLASDDRGTATSLNSVIRVNTDAASRRYLVIIDGSAGDVGDFELEVQVTDPLAGDTCQNATPITLTGGSALLSAQTTSYYANDYASGSGCSGFSGGERVYRVEVLAGQAIAITATPEAASDVALNVIEGAASGSPESACASGLVCAGSANGGSAGAAERLLYRNTTSAAKLLFVTVEPATSSAVAGSFDLAVETLAPVPGETCATAPTVTFTSGVATFTGESLDASFGDYGSGTKCTGTGGAERGYALEIPAGKVLVATVAAASGSSLNPSLNLASASSCTASARTCLAGADASGGTEVLRYANNDAAPQQVVLFVETASSSLSPPSTYDLTLELTDPPAGELCGSAVPATPGTPMTSQTLIGYASDYGSGSSCSGASGPDRVYVATVAAGERITATVTPTPNALDPATVQWDPSINLQLAAGCVASGRACLAGSDTGSSGAADTVRWTNTSGTEQQVFIVVETYTSSAPSATATRLFTLDVTMDVPPPPPPGDACSTAQAIGAGTLTGESLAGMTNDYGSGSGCSGTSGADRVYAISIPPGEKLTATVTPTATAPATTWDASINIQSVATCLGGTRTCLAGRDSGGVGIAETVTLSNTGAAPIDVFIVIETFSSTPSSTASLTFDLETKLDVLPPAPTDDVCRDTLPLISSDTTLATESLAAYSSDFERSTSGACETVSSSSGGMDRVYRVEIPAGKTLTALLTPDSSWDPTISLVLGNETACVGAIVCEEGVDTGFDGDPETLTYTNGGTAPQGGFLIVDSWDRTSTTGFPYSLAVTFTP